MKRSRFALLVVLSLPFQLQQLYGQKEQPLNTGTVMDSTMIAMSNNVGGSAAKRASWKVHLDLKVQFPIQDAIGLGFISPGRLSGYMGFGMLSRAYTVTALDLIPAKNDNEKVRQQFIKDKLENGFVFELGGYYHFQRLKGFYTGFFLQFQRFTMSVTPQEMVENYDFGDTQGLSDNLQEILDNNEAAQSFYENTILVPTVRPIQVGLAVGKSFQLRKIPRLTICPELSYQMNLTTKSSIESDSFVGQIIVNQIISPILSSGSSANFKGFNVPGLTLKISYELGKTVHR